MFFMINKGVSGRGEISSKDDASIQDAKRVLTDTVNGARCAARKTRTWKSGRRGEVFRETVRYNMASLKRMHDFALQDTESVCSNA
jgi:hypothetical protein